MVDLVLLTHFLFRDKEEAGQKSLSVAEGCHGSQGVLRREYKVLYSYFFPSIIFERSVKLVGCFWLYAKGHTQCCVLDCSTCYSSQCDTQVEEDGQRTETMMVPATFTKHLVTIAANMTKRKRLEEESRATQGKEGDAHKSYGNGRFTIAIFCCPFLRLPFKKSALQVSESDSRIAIDLCSHTTESLSRYVHLL